MEVPEDGVEDDGAGSDLAEASEDEVPSLGHGQTVLHQLRVGQARLEDVEVGHLFFGDLKIFTSLNPSQSVTLHSPVLSEGLL